MNSKLLLALSLSGALLFCQNAYAAQSGTEMMLSRWSHYRDAMQYRRQRPRTKPIWVRYAGNPPRWQR